MRLLCPQAQAALRVSIVRPGLRVLEVPYSVLAPMEPREQHAQPGNLAGSRIVVAGEEETTGTAESSKAASEEPDAWSGPATFAQLIHRHAKPLQVPRLASEANVDQNAHVPSVKRLDVENQLAANAARQVGPAANVQVAKPINTKAEETPIRGIKPQLAEPQIAEQQIVETQTSASQIAEPQIAKAQSASQQIAESERAEPVSAEPDVSEPSSTLPQVTERPSAGVADSNLQQIPLKADESSVVDSYGRFG